MALASLQDVYIDQLQDIYSANRQSHEAPKKLVVEASDDELRSALERGVRGIEDGLDTVELIIRTHDADPTGEFCKGMEGLVKEVHAHVLDADIEGDDVRDAMIITQYQRMTHYALAGYECLVAFAKRLGHNDQADKLQICLDNTYDGDREMTPIAEGGVNEAAAA